MASTPSMIKREQQLPHLVHPSNEAIRSKESIPVCSFESFSLHFDLPLKAAAEKFGVRATAFKKRCRAIGIRHWPYRKVRSLKRSIQELGRCKENGTITEKQRYQHMAYKRQLDKLMSPQTYGIDLPGHSPEYMDDEDSSTASNTPEDDDEDDHDFHHRIHYTSLHPKSPQYDHYNLGGAVSPIHVNDRPPFGLNLSSASATLNPLTLSYHRPEGGMRNTQFPGIQAPPERYNNDPQVTANVGSELASLSGQTDSSTKSKVNGIEDFHEALDQMEYGSEKHFLDDLFIELSPIYDCKV